jgi:hypothetical protein
MNTKFLRRTLTCSVLLGAAGGAVYAELQSGQYASEGLGSIQQAAPAEFSADAKHKVPAYPSYPPELALGEGRQETVSFCSMCHSTRYITMQPPLPAGAWEAEVNKMTKVYGASIPDAAAKKITLYLQQHYAPENRK